MKKLCVVLLVSLFLLLVSCGNDDPTVSVNDNGYVVVNGTVTDIIADKDDVITVDNDGYIVVDGIKTEYRSHKNVIGDSDEVDKPLTECCDEVISLLSERIEDEDYIYLYTSIDFEETLSSLQAGNYSQSTAIYEISLSKEDFFYKAQLDSTLSKDLYDSIYFNYFEGIVPRIISSSHDPTNITLTTILRAHISFVNESLTEPKIYLFTFENGTPIAITLIPDGYGAIRATGYFLLNDSFKTDNENNIKASCQTFGFVDVSVKKL